MLSDKQLDFLSLCSIERISWYLLAREAQRPSGLDLLLDGEISEKNVKAETRNNLRNGIKHLPELRKSVQERVAPADKLGAKLTTVLDEDYPLNLRSIFNLPPFLFYVGGLKADDLRSVAIVGSRQASMEGLTQARMLAGELVGKDVTILSGLALGIDTAAHEGTLCAGGKTIAVMGTGICHTYPPENKSLAVEIIEKGGAIVSQFWPLTSPTSYTFPRRNVTMSGMGQGTIVVEASATSGAKLQAHLALQHGKKVFLLKSLIENHEWARKYLHRGAIQVDKVDTIIANLVPPSQIRRQLDEALQLRLNFG